jgi:hypothetical protein
MEITELKSSSSLATTVEGSTKSCAGELTFVKSKQVLPQRNSLRARLQNRIKENKKLVNEMNSLISECDSDTKILHTMRKEIELDNISYVNDCIDRLKISTSNALQSMQRQ